MFLSEFVFQYSYRPTFSFMWVVAVDMRNDSGILGHGSPSFPIQIAVVNAAEVVCSTHFGQLSFVLFSLCNRSPSAQTEILNKQNWLVDFCVDFATRTNKADKIYISRPFPCSFPINLQIFPRSCQVSPKFAQYVAKFPSKTHLNKSRAGPERVPNGSRRHPERVPKAFRWLGTNNEGVPNRDKTQ